jgi:hypothetical protein
LDEDRSSGEEPRQTQSCSSILFTNPRTFQKHSSILLPIPPHSSCYI